MRSWDLDSPLRHFNLRRFAWSPRTVQTRLSVWQAGALILTCYIAWATLKKGLVIGLWFSPNFHLRQWLFLVQKRTFQVLNSSLLVSRPRLFRVKYDFLLLFVSFSYRLVTFGNVHSEPNSQSILNYRYKTSWIFWAKLAKTFYTLVLMFKICTLQLFRIILAEYTYVCRIRKTKRCKMQVSLYYE